MEVYMHKFSSLVRSVPLQRLTALRMYSLVKRDYIVGELLKGSFV